jgi:hypothetical protein
MHFDRSSAINLQYPNNLKGNLILLRISSLAQQLYMYGKVGEFCTPKGKIHFSDYT